MSDASNDTRARLASRLLVVALGSLFFLGLGGFVVSVLDARERSGTPAPPSLPAMTDASASPNVASGSPGALSVAPAATAVALSAPTPTQPPTVTPVPQGAEPVLLVALIEPRPAPNAAAPAAAPAATPSPSPAGAGGPAGTSDPAAATPSPSGSTSPAASGSAAPLLEQEVPVVPVAGFWSNKEGLGRRELLRALESGSADGYRHVIVEQRLADALVAAGITIGDEVRRGDLEDVGRVIRKKGLGVVAATDLAPSMRALAMDGKHLVGNDRVRKADAWPLRVSMALPEGEGWDQSSTWTLVAGGDAFTDRGVYDTVVRRGKGIDFPFDGGTARVTGHGCCDPVYHANEVPRYELTGNKGAVRRLFSGADLAIANHEMPVTEGWGFHGSGFTFSGKPELTEIFRRAGIDWMSLANNHIKDYGSDGIADSRRILRKYGIAFGGAGEDLGQARRISYLEAGPVRLAIIPCVGVAPSIWAEDDLSGATPCLDRYLVRDIKEARRNADVVIVFPHWGVEYTRLPLLSSRKHALKWVRAGADLVLGSHSHVAGAIEEIEGIPVLYSLGNLVFDQRWSTNTMESMLVEATFEGDRLVDLHLRPYIVHDMAQPNLLDEGTGEGRRLRAQVRSASTGLLDW